MTLDGILEWIFVSLTTQQVITLNYSAIADIHALHITVTHILVFLVFF
jgi:hypothetical protein